MDTYDLPFDHQDDEAPTFLSFSLGAVTFQDRPPSLSVVLQRPDGTEVPLLRATVRGPRPGEEPPYVRHAETPLRVLVSADPEVAEAVVDLYAEAYGVTLPAPTSRPRPAGPLRHAGRGRHAAPPARDYRAEVRVAVADPADSLDWLRVVVGGSVYGLLGTDGNGRDLTEGLVFGLPVALLIGIAAAIVSTAIGTGLGLLSGYMGGRVDLVIQRTADIVNNVPLLPLLIFMVFVLGAQLWLILLVLVAFSWPGLTILVRSMVLGLRAARRWRRRGRWAPRRGTSCGGTSSRTRRRTCSRSSSSSCPRSSWPRPDSRSSAWAIRRCRPGARSSRTASAPARCSWATGGGSSRPACSSSSRR